MFEEIRKEVEAIFDDYRKHKYYTLFIQDFNVSVTSTIDRVGGGRSNLTSDKVADAAIKRADEVVKAKEFVEKVEHAVNQLPDLERDIIILRYMNKNHSYIFDRTIYEMKIPMSDKTYRKVRNDAFTKLFSMLS